MTSMTGFGSGQLRTPDLELDIALRTVNGRFLDIRVHSPKEYLGFESNIKKAIGKYISRGTVDVYVTRRSYVGHELSVRINETAVRSWKTALRQLQKSAKSSGEIQLETMVNLAGVVMTHDLVKLGKNEKANILETLEKALTNCTKERAREGAALKKNLALLLDDIQKHTNEMKNLRILANEELKKRYSEKIEKWQLEQGETMRVGQELSFLLDKSDIDEELARLAEHVKNCKSLIGKTGPVGKKLDFYSQELLREVNTVGSKSQLSELTKVVVETKSVIEKLREQVQNIE